MRGLNSERSIEPSGLVGRGRGPFEEEASRTFATLTAEAPEDCILTLLLPLHIGVLFVVA